MTKNILIFGASGRTGHELVNQALAQGYMVTAYVRNPTKLKISHPNLSVVQGDVTDYQKVAAAIKGHDAVISTLGAASPFKYDQPVVDGMANIVKAMEQEKVERLIYMSAINVAETRPNAGMLIRIMGATLLKNETGGHEARENIIRNSKLAWTMVRPGGLSDGKHTGKYRSGLNIKAKSMAAAISRADVADFLLRQVTDDSYIRNTPTVMY